MTTLSSVPPNLFTYLYLSYGTKDTLMEICLENGVDDYELRSEVDGCPLSPQQEGQVRFCIRELNMREK